MLQKNSLWRVLQVFMQYPTQRHHIRKISKRIGLATTSVKNHIEELKKESLVKEGKDIFKYFIANFENERFRFYKKIDSLDCLEHSGVLEYIEEKTGSETIILFGSLSKGEDTETSDIDLYVQAPEQELDIEKFEAKFEKKIQLHFSEDLGRVPKELRNNIINGIRLRGFLKVF